MYVCTLRCPHFAAPCEIGSVEYEQIATYKTPCPIGENDSFLYIDEKNLFMCLVVGSRTFSDYSYFSMKMDKILASKTDKTIVILSGGAGGTDSLAERYAKERNYVFLCMPADWEKGKVQVMSAMIKCTNIWLLMKTEDVLRSGMVILKGQCIVLYWQKNMLIKSD